MIRLVSPLMACLLAIHALLGCCSHHAHDESCHHTQAAAVGHIECDHCEPGLDDHQQPSVDSLAADQANHEEPADSDPHDRDCGKCHGVCTFVRGKCVQIDAPEAAGLVQSLVGLPPDSDRSAAGPNRFVTHPPGLHPPVRLHLVHQVLVI